MIGANDQFIAAHARSLGVTLVTNNVAEFRRVKGLDLENWTLPKTRSRSNRDEWVGAEASRERTHPEETLRLESKSAQEP